jgi:hypothetical protein
MRARLLALFVVAALSAVGAAAAAKPHPRAVRAAPRIPALPVRDIGRTNLCPIPREFRAAFQRAARDTGFQLSMLVAVAEVESRFVPTAR